MPQSKSANTTTVSTAEDNQEQDDESKIIHNLLSRLELPVVRIGLISTADD